MIFAIRIVRAVQCARDAGAFCDARRDLKMNVDTLARNASCDSICFVASVVVTRVFRLVDG